jgi:hypothetical protein
VGAGFRGRVRESGPRGYTQAGRVDVGEKNNLFLAETLSKLRFFCSFHLFVITQPDGWVRCEEECGPELDEKSFQLSSLLLLIVCHISTYLILKQGPLLPLFFCPS